jgi:predicted RNA-binding protein Jag
VRKEEDKRKERKRFHSDRPQADEAVKQTIKEAEAALLGQMSSYMVKGLNAFQRKMIHRHFEKTQEYKSKTYRENDTDYVLKIFPVGQLRRFAEQKAQEVLMKGEREVLPPMGAFERFVIHEYLKDRSGIRTESFGEGAERHIEIVPVFGRTLKKAKRRLTR